MPPSPRPRRLLAALAGAAHEGACCWRCIRGYQYLLRPMLGSNCRFYPSCSDYAREAIERHGALRGIWLAVKRVAPLPPVSSGRLRPRSLTRLPTRRARSRARHAPTVAWIPNASSCSSSSRSPRSSCWEAWQQEHAPPPPPTQQAAPGRAAERRAREGPAGAVGRRRRAARAPAAERAVAGRRAAATGGQTVTIKTDLYTAEVDTAAASSRWSRSTSTATRHDTDQAVPRAAAQRRAHVRRAGRPARRRPAQPPHDCTRCCPGPRELAPGADRVELKLAATAAERRQGRAGADVPSRQLRDRRRVRRHQRRQRADRALRVFPAHARHQAGGRAELDGARGVSSARSSTTSKDKFKKVEFGEIDKLAADPIAQAAVSRRAPTTAGSAWSSTTSSPRGCRPTRRRRRASSTRRSSTTASTRPA